ncbi:MAG: DNA polymerase domain-containing protein, partial [Bacteroidota bacterium]
PDVLEVARDYIGRLQAGSVNSMELVIRRNISQEASEYSNNSVNAVVARLVEEMGVHLAAGERIEYIIIDQSGKRKPEKAKPLALYAFEDGYDIEKYTELALKAVETLLLPFGYDVERLKEEFDKKYKFCYNKTKEIRKKTGEHNEPVTSTNFHRSQYLLW